MEWVARYDNKWLSSSFTISGMLKMSQHIKVRVWPLWNQKLNKDIMERFILVSWTPTQNWSQRDIFVKDHFPPNEDKIQNVPLMIKMLYSVYSKMQNWYVLQSDSNLDFLPPRHTQGHCLSLILSVLKHKSRLPSTTQYWPLGSRSAVFACTFSLSSTYFSTKPAAAY